MPSNLCLDSDSMPNDFHFLKDTDLNFDPQYDFPAPIYRLFISLGDLGIPWVTHTFHSSSIYPKRQVLMRALNQGFL